MSLVERLVGYANRAVESIIVVAYGALIANIAAAVFFRYVLNDSLVWAEELARYLFIWIVFLAAGLGVGLNIHVGLDYVPALLGPRQKRILQIAIAAGVGAFLAVLIVVGIQLAVFGMRTSTMMLGVRMAYVYTAVPVGAVIMMLNLLANTRRLVAGGGEKRTG